MDTVNLDQSIQALQDHKDEWTCLSIPKKLALLEQTLRRLAENCQAWVEASVKGKQMQLLAPEAGEEWTGGPWTLAEGINGYIDSLRALEHGQILMPGKIHTLINGQVAARVFPNSLFDKLMFNGITAEVWMQPGVTQANLTEKMAAFYKQENPPGKVALILGAGNVAGIPPRDMLHRLYSLGHVVILKMSPINDYLGPVFETIFAPFIQAGYLRFAYGGGDVGSYLVQHPGVEEIHMTGGVHTYQAILFGSGPEGEARKRLNQPLLKKPFTGELGGVTPTIIVPGKWSKADICYQAENVATMKLQNAGCNCVASQVLVLSKTWPQHDEFLEALRKLMQDLPARNSYYPGTADRQQEAVRAHPEAELFSGDVPRSMIVGVDPAAEAELCFQKELFSPVLAQVDLPGRDTAEFLQKAVQFCNEKLYGTLALTILIHPKTVKQLGAEFESAQTDLHYGAIGVNIWNASAFLLVQATWGAFPGSTTDNIQSGFGIVGNSFMFESPERTVMRASFYPFPRSWLHGDPAFLPKPPWFVTNKTAHVTARRVAKITIDPKWRYLPGIIWSGLRG